MIGNFRKWCAFALSAMFSLSAIAQANVLPVDDPYEVATRPINGRDKAQVQLVNAALRAVGAMAANRANIYSSYRKDSTANLPPSFSSIEIYNPNSYEIMGTKILNFGLPTVDLASYMGYCSYANSAARDYNKDYLNPINEAHDNATNEIRKLNSYLGEPFKTNAYDANELDKLVVSYGRDLSSAISAYNDSRKIKLGPQDVDYFLQEIVSAVKDGSDIGFGIAKAAGSSLLSADDLSEIAQLKYPLTLPGGEYPFESPQELAEMLKLLNEGFSTVPEIVELLKKIEKGKTPSEVALALANLTNFIIKKLDVVMKDVDGRTKTKREFNKSKTGAAIVVALAKIAVDREKLVVAIDKFNDVQRFRPNQVQSGCWNDMSAHINSSLKIDLIFATTSLIGDIYDLGKKVTLALAPKQSTQGKNPALKKIQGFVGLAEAGIQSFGIVFSHINTTDNRVAGLKYFRQLDSDKLLYSQFELALSKAKGAYANVCKAGIKPLLDRANLKVAAVPPAQGVCYEVVLDLGPPGGSVITLNPLGVESGVWDAAKSFVVTAKSIGPNKGVTLQVMSASGLLSQAEAPMEPMLVSKDGSTDWSALISGASQFATLADGTFPLRAVLTSLDGRQLLSAPIQLKIARQLSGSVIASPQGILNEGDRLAFNGTSTNAKSIRIEYSSPQKMVDEKFQLDPVNGNWTYQTVAGSNGVYQFTVFAVGTRETKPIGSGSFEVLNKVRVGVPQGSVSPPVNQSALVNQKVLIAGLANGREPVQVKVIFSDPTTGSQLIEQAARLPQGGWSVSRSFPVAGSYNYRAEVKDATSPNPISIGQGKLDISDTPSSTKVSGSVGAFPPTISTNSSWTVTGRIAGSDEVLLDFYVAGATSPTRDRASSVNAADGTWAYSRKFPVAGTYTFKAVGVQRASKVEHVIGNGSVSVVNDQPALTDGMTLAKESPEDGTVLDVGQVVRKTWFILNTGSTTWTSAFCLRPLSGATLASAPICVNGTVSPGQTFPFATNMTMPATTVGTASVKQNWRLTNAVGDQVGTPVFALFAVKAKPPALKVLELTLPTAVRAGTEAWVGNISTNATATQVQLVLVDPQGRNTPIAWSQTSANSWAMQHTFAAEGSYRWTLTATGPTGADTRNGVVNVLKKVVVDGSASVNFIANSRAVVGEPWQLDVTTSHPAHTVRLQYGSGGQLIALTKLSDTQFRYTQAFTSPGQAAFTIKTTFVSFPVLSSPGTVQVMPKDVVVTPPPPPPSSLQPLAPVLTKTDAVQAGTSWSARLVTAAPVDTADLIFQNGRRIRFEGAQTQWTTPGSTTKFNEAGDLPYTLELRRTATSQPETFAGGVLRVLPAVVATITPTITSALTTEQGKPYNLTVTTSAPADKVTVAWPDSTGEQGLQPANPTRTQWAFGNRLFMQAQPQSLVVRTYGTTGNSAAGETRATLNVTVPNASMRLLEISRNIIRGEDPYFTVEASLAVKRVSVKLGTEPAFELVGSGPSGAVQNFRARVPARQSGSAVPYVLTAMNEQGQSLGSPLTGTVAVADVGDSLNVPNPVPAEGVSQGESVNWRFGTFKNPDQMWMEFSAPLGTVQLVGAYLKLTVNAPPGNYAYKLMRKDYLGNVFAIQGASGTLLVKSNVITPNISKLVINGMEVVAGAKISLPSSGALNVQAVATKAPGIVLVFEGPPSIGAFTPVRFTSTDGSNWTGTPIPGLDRLFGTMTPGVYAAKAFWGPDPNTNLGGTLAFSVDFASAVAAPAINAVQPQGQALVSQPAVFLFQGQNLLPSVVVTVANCDQPQTQLVSTTQIRHQCTPRLAGQQQAGWKALPTEVALRPLGGVTIGAAPVTMQVSGVSPLAIGLDCPDSAPKNVTFTVQGTNLSPDLVVEVAGAQCGNDKKPASNQVICNVGVQHRQLVVRDKPATLGGQEKGRFELRVGPGACAPPPTAVSTAITSGLSAEQGKPYNLTVTTSEPVERVTVAWPDASGERGLTAVNPSRTQWAFGNRLFMQSQPQAFAVRTYKNNPSTPAGEIRATLNISAPSVSMRLLAISPNPTKGEDPYFTVEASLSVNRVSVRLGTEPAVELAGTGISGALSRFGGKVPARQAGRAVPYVITAMNDQGQPLGSPLTGTVAVAEVGDALNVPNPVPAAGIAQGETVSWRFGTLKAPDQMWMEFAAPIGNVQLAGAYLNMAINAPPGNYAYKLMRKDYLGNVFAIQGASGTLLVRPSQVVTPQPVVSAVQPQVQPVLNQPATFVFVGQNLTADVRVTVATCDQPQTLLVSPTQIRHQCIPRQAGQQQAGWKVNAAEAAVRPLGAVNVVAPSPVAFKITSVSVSAPGVSVGQPLTFGAAVDDISDVLRAELVFPDLNVTEPMTQNGNSFSHQRVMTSAGVNRVFEVRVYRKSGGQSVIRPGNYTVQPTVLPAVQPVVTAVQPQGQLMLGQAAVFMFQGRDLLPSVAVTVANCDQPQTQLLNPSQIRHQCTPRQAGQQQVGWKANATEAVLSSLGTVNVVAPPPAVPVANIVGTGVTPPVVAIGQTMTFGVTVDVGAGVERAELFFPDANLTEPMTQVAANVWTRTRQMQQAGANRPYTVKVFRKGGAEMRAPGVYNVTVPAPAPAQPLVPAQVPQQPQPSVAEVSSAPGCSPDGAKMCGVDGRTYPNACTLTKAGVAKRANGPC